MTPERILLLDRYRDGARALRAVLTNVTPDDLDRPGPDGGWTARQVAHHVSESEARAFVRLRQLIAEEAPVIAAYDEGLYALRDHYERPIGSALAVVEAVRASNAELLGSLSDEEWERAGIHTDTGRYSVDDWLRTYASHPHGHADQVRRALGRPAAPRRGPGRS